MIYGRARGNGPPSLGSNSVLAIADTMIIITLVGRTITKSDNGFQIADIIAQLPTTNSAPRRFSINIFTAAVRPIFAIEYDRLICDAA